MVNGVVRASALIIELANYLIIELSNGYAVRVFGFGVVGVASGGGYGYGVCAAGEFAFVVRPH